jgi:hypothetical protein
MQRDRNDLPAGARTVPRPTSWGPKRGGQPAQQRRLAARKASHDAQEQAEPKRPWWLYDRD